MNEMYESYKKLVDNIPTELLPVLGRFAMKLCQEQKQKSTESFKLVNIKNIDEVAWIKVENAQDDIVDGELVFNYQLYFKENGLG